MTLTSRTRALTSRCTRVFLVLLATLGFLHSAQAQNWPTQTVRIVVPYPAGGGIDVLGRALAEKLATLWGQPVVVENRPGSATFVGAVAVARAPADGYTLLLTSDSTVSINPHLFAKMPYNAEKDFAPVSNLVIMHLLLSAHPSVAAKTLPELISLAKAKPGVLNYASYGVGSQPHLIMEVLKSKADINLVHIPYKGGPESIRAAIASEVQLAISNIPSAKPHIEAGLIKPLAIGGTQRSTHLPNVPTFAELGYQEVGASAWYGLLAPAGTPPQIVARISRDVNRVFSEPAFRERQIAGGFEVVPNSPQEFADYLRIDSENRAKAVALSGIKVQ